MSRAADRGGSAWWVCRPKLSTLWRPRATVTNALEPVVFETVHRKIAFLTGPFGNFVELAEVTGST
jgi:hypothetical protein